MLSPRLVRGGLAFSGWLRPGVTDNPTDNESPRSVTSMAPEGDAATSSASPSPCSQIWQTDVAILRETGGKVVGRVKSMEGEYVWLAMESEDVNAAMTLLRWAALMGLP